jgi:hypothetical protein
MPIFDFKPFGGYVHTRWTEIDAFNKLFFMNQNTLKGKIDGKNASSVFLKQLECQECERVFHKKFSLSFHEKTVHRKKAQSIESSSQIQNVPNISKRTIESLLMEDKPNSGGGGSPRKKVKEVKDLKKSSLSINESTPKMTREERYLLRASKQSGSKETGEVKNTEACEEKAVSSTTSPKKSPIKTNPLQSRESAKEELKSSDIKSKPSDDDIICLSSDDEEESAHKEKEREKFLDSLHSSINKLNEHINTINGEKKKETKTNEPTSKICKSEKSVPESNSNTKQAETEVNLTKISESQSAKNVSHEKSPIKLELPSFVMHADNKDRAFVNIRNILDYTETEIRALSHSPRLKLPDEFLNKIKRGKPVFQPESKEDPSIPNIKEKESVQEMDEGYSSSTSSNLGEVEKTNETSIMTAVDKCTDAPTIVVIDDEDENQTTRRKKEKSF